MLRKTLAAVAILAMLLLASVWLIAHRDVSDLRARLAAAPPVPPVVRNAYVKAEPLALERPRFTWRAMLPPRRGVAMCAPTLLGRVAGRAQYPVPLVVAALFTPDELLRIHAHEFGIENASRVYFGKSAAELSRDEAEIVVAMMRSRSFAARYGARPYPLRQSVSTPPARTTNVSSMRTPNSRSGK
jgi:hypothetical protein